jgi:REP element-mobilizing transposase RayT
MPTRRHLRRLDQVWIEAPICFITTNVAGRRELLANAAVFAIISEELASAPSRHGWLVGRFVVMPDHLHFFCAEGGKDDPVPLSRFLGNLKEWIAKRIVRSTGATPPIWQPEFFDRVLRSSESYEQKWQYVRENPVRAGLVKTAEDWPWAGELARL